MATSQHWRPWVLQVGVILLFFAGDYPMRLSGEPDPPLGDAIASPREQNQHKPSVFLCLSLRDTRALSKGVPHDCQCRKIYPPDAA